jgi:hypothetical protein
VITLLDGIAERGSPMYYNFARIHKSLRVTPAMAADFSLLWQGAIMLQESGFQNSFIPSAWWRIRSGDIPPSPLGHFRRRRRSPQ